MESQMIRNNQLLDTYNVVYLTIGFMQNELNMAKTEMQGTETLRS